MMQSQPMLCPRCGKPLGLQKDPHGALWRCSQCSGVAANLAVLRKHLEDDVANDFWRRASRASVPSEKYCPSCSKPLREFIAVHEQQSLRLDLCRPCQLMWFDPGELEVFPESKKPMPSEVDQQPVLTTSCVEDSARQDTVALYVNIGFEVLRALLRLRLFG